MKRLFAALAALAVLCVPAHSVAELLFEALPPLTVSKAPEFFAVGNFNGDAADDLVVVSPRDKDITLLLGGVGNGFTVGTVQHVGRQLNYVAVADLNQDGLDDIAVTDRGENGVWIFLGNGNGTLDQPYLVPVGREPLGIVVGNFDSANGNDMAG